MSILTDEVMSLVGASSEPSTSSVPVSEEMLRRFAHGVMEEQPMHLDHAAAAASRYGELVATPLFPLHAGRRPLGAPDPFERFGEDPEDDGTLGMAGIGLPPIDLPLNRILNGGTEASFHQLARIGDVITSQSRYVDIFEKQGRDGSPMVFVRIETTYTNQDDALLAVITTTMIRR